MSKLGQSIAGQLATSTKLIKDLVGIDIAEIVNGRAAGAAAGAAAGEHFARRAPRATADDAVTE